MSENKSAPEELLSELSKIIQEGRKSKVDKFKEKFDVEINASDFLGELTKIKQEFEKLEEQLPDLVIEEPTMEPLPENVPIVEKQEDDLVEASAKVIKKRIHEVTNLFSLPPVETYPTTMKLIQKRIEMMEQWIYKISAEGPGGGAGDVINLDHQTTLVTSSSYTVSRKDYYVGINYAGTVTVTLPAVAKNGRYIIIKDESGRCSKFPIIVHGNVDNDVNGFILKINNGGIQMIYRNGWRIV
jgi:hypothetical protein